MLPTEIHDLVTAVSNASPRDTNAQTEILDRLEALRELMRQGGQPDLAAYLDAACLATETLATSSGPTPERIGVLVARLVEHVEAAFHSGAADAKAVRSLPTRMGSKDLGVLLRMESAKRLGEILVQRGRITREQVDEALRAQRATGVRFGEALVMLGAVTWEDIHDAIRVQGRSHEPATGTARPRH